ncbi:MAG TPA: heavy-metal-associated domain-containing protein [Polyangiaceae bacterium]|nr:heavy-metal-associated domain-containing protein [Polyangiaceae bacterium]
MDAKFKIEGMTCGGCAASVKKALEKIGLPAQVSLADKTVTVPGPVDEALVKEAVEAAGYDFGGRLE